MDIKTGLGLLLPVARNVLGLDSARDTLGAFTAQLGDMDLTILFTDIDDYASLIDRLGDARAQHLVRVHNAIVRKTLRDAGGIEVKHTGDGILACFLSAARALDCACAIQAKVAGYSASNAAGAFRVAIGLNTGDPIHEEGDIYGTAVITASRVADLADGGQILVTDVVRLLCAGKGFRFVALGERRLEGLAEPCNVFEVSWQCAAVAADAELGSVSLAAS
jgi:class 3 adenylate cyclase